MKKIIIIILLILLIPFFIITIKDIDREEVNPTLDLILTETQNSIIDLNNHTLREVFETPIYSLEDFVIDDYAKSTSKTLLVALNDIIYTTFDIDVLNGTITSTTNRIVTTSPSTLKFGLEEGIEIGSKQITVNVDFGITPRIVFVYGTNDGDANRGYVNYIYMYNQTKLGISDLTVVQMDYWYNVYTTYSPSYDYIQFGTATAGDYLLLQQLIIDNASEDFKLYRDDVIDEVHYVMTQNVDNIVVSDVDGNELFILYSDDTYISRTSLSDTTTLSFVGYNITGYIDGDFNNTVLAFFWIIPILLVGALFFIILKGKERE